MGFNKKQKYFTPKNTVVSILKKSVFFFLEFSATPKNKKLHTDNNQ